ncbi:unnamed protein product [Plutella xylostella]|uniref:(diamondback moth) hypothetical protein n=1 Tax=Plutella xylostella TaxID=51655 RepID=A0A8S4G5E1_PLUXY|nr:unnamed protein product [Plutella xylostella]
MSGDQKVMKKKYRLVAPDGGWGYMICVAVTILNITSMSFMPCLGLIFNDLFIELKIGSTGFALMNGLASVAFSIAAYAAGPLFKVMNFRQMSVLGSALNVLGCLGTYLAKSDVSFYIWQTIAGAGGGFLYNVSCTVINSYFVKKRLLSISVTQFFPAFTGMVTPLLVKWMLEEYGCRGTLLIMAGVNLENFVAAALIQPVEWHLVKEEVDEEEEEELLVTKPEQEKTVVIKIKDDGNPKESSSSPEKCDDTNIKCKHKGRLRTITDMLHLNLLTNFAVISICMGLSFSGFCDFTFWLMLPQALIAMNMDKQTIAWTMTLYSCTDVATRVCLMVFNKLFARIGSKNIYMIGLALAFVTRIAMLGTENVTLIITYLSIMGTSRCIITTLMPLVLADCVEQDLFAQALGILMLIFGLSNILLGPVIGAIRDMTNSYAASFYILTSFYAIVLLFWSIEMCVLRNRKKELKQQNILMKSNKPK